MEFLPYYGDYCVYYHHWYNIQEAFKVKGFLKGFKKGMTSFGENIIVIINTILLFAVYVIGVGLTAIIAKLTNKQFMDMRISRNQKSYWSDLNLKKRDKEEYYRQF